MGVHFGMLEAGHMVHINEDGQVIGGNRVAVNAAGFTIHAAIHKARPDVDAACHAHSKYGKAWSTFGKPLEMISQDACIFYNDHSVYSDFGGVVFEDDEGARIAKALGPKNRSVILQNHGLLTAGKTVDEAAYCSPSWRGHVRYSSWWKVLDCRDRLLVMKRLSTLIDTMRTL